MNASGGKATDFGFESIPVDPLSRQKTTNHIPEKAEYQLEVSDGSDQTRPVANDQSRNLNIVQNPGSDAD